MSKIDQHTLKILEYDRIVEIVSGKSLTPFGKDQILKIQPLFDKADIKTRQAEISQMKDIINFGDSFPLVRINDPREILKRSKIENNFLEPEEFNVILELIEAGDALSGYDKEGRTKYPAIDEYLKEIRAFPEIIKAIKKVFDENGVIKDNASQELKRIRNELQDSRRRIMRLLEKKLSAYQKKAGMQEDIITQRNGRYVITIPSDQYRSDTGILQDRSQSGATLYVEPNDAVELNNSINMLCQQERIEVIRILKTLTQEIAKRHEQLSNNVRLVGRIDKIHACATYSNEIKGHAPQIADEAEFELFGARHPLLIRSFENYDDVVPSDISLGRDRQAIVVTGPNTGGKTVSLKTVGLLILMAQSGLHISADDNSSVGIFNDIFADIGDEQSIEQSLSTFSSHINNIIRGLKHVSPESLYLFDEIGAGTDPKEGAALAESIILYVVKSGAKIIATTHYSQLKTLPQQHPEVDNASLEFDRKTLAPTYRIQIGLPGSSYAVEIAKRLGLPAEICERALEQIGDKERSLSDLITDLEAELSKVRKDKTELTERLEEARRLEQEYKTESDKLKKSTDEEKHKALSDTSTFLDTTRKEVERLVAEIRKSQASEESVKQFHQRIKEAQSKIGEQLRAKETKTRTWKFKKGDKVSVLTLNKEGEIEEILDKEKVRVKIGNMYTTVEIRHLTPVENETAAGKKRSSSKLDVESNLSPEVHLRGMTVEEALEKLDKYMDQAVVAGLRRIYVIHGKGTGTLRRILSDYLRNHSEVDSIRLGDWNEGGAGVTVVKLKE